MVVQQVLQVGVTQPQHQHVTDIHRGQQAAPGGFIQRAAEGPVEYRHGLADQGSTQGGSALAANNSAVLAFTNTLLAPCATLLVWIGLDAFRTGKDLAEWLAKK